MVTRQNFGQLDTLQQMAQDYGAQLRVTRLRPSGRGKDVWHDLHPTQAQNRELYFWLKARPDVMTGDLFFHLSAFGAALDGLNMCGAGRIVCLVDPVGDVYACPFLLAPEFKSGSVRDPGGFANVWHNSILFKNLRDYGAGTACKSCKWRGACHSGCMAVKHFTGTPLDDPDPECVYIPEDGSRRVIQLLPV